MKPTPLLAALAALLILPASAWDNDVPMFDEVVADKLAAAKPADTKSAAAKPADTKSAAAKPADTKSAAAKPSAAKPGAAKPAATAADSFSSSKPKPSGGSSGALSFGKPKAAESAELVTVEAKGQGETVEAAKKDAARNAIKKAVGELVDAKTLVENDELVEDKILTLSNAMIEKADYGDARSVGDGLFEVPVKAVVKKGKLNQELKAVGLATGTVAGDSLAATMFTGKERLANAEKFFTERFKGFPSNVMEAVMLTKEDGSPAVDIDPMSGHVYANVSVQVNMENYDKWAQSLCELLGQVCADKEVGVDYSLEEAPYFYYCFRDGFRLQRGDSGRLESDIDPSGSSKVCVATPQISKWESFPVSIFWLDKEMWTSLERALVKMVDSKNFPHYGYVEIAFKDEDGSVVRSKRRLMDGHDYAMSHNEYATIGTNIFGSNDIFQKGLPAYGNNCYLFIAPLFGRDKSEGYGYADWTFRLDLGEMSDDDLAKVTGYEVKVEYVGEYMGVQ